MSDNEERPSSQIGNIVSDVTVKALKEMETGDMNTTSNPNSRPGSSHSPKPPSGPPSKTQSRKSSAKGSRPTSVNESKQLDESGSRPNSRGKVTSLEITGSRPSSANKEKQSEKISSRPTSGRISGGSQQQITSPRLGSGQKTLTPTPGSKTGSNAGSKPSSQIGSRPGSRPTSIKDDGIKSPPITDDQPTNEIDDQSIDRNFDQPTDRTDEQITNRFDDPDVVEPNGGPRVIKSRPESKEVDEIKEGTTNELNKEDELENKDTTEEQGDNMTTDLVPVPTESTELIQSVNVNDLLNDINYNDGGGDGGDGGDDDDPDNNSGDFNEYNDNDDDMEEENDDNDVVDDDDRQELFVLDADHPLMARFQKALKKHLTQVDDKLTLELREIQETLKKKDTQRENVGVELYGVQQELARYQSTLENLHDKQSELKNEQLEMEQHLDNVRILYGKEQGEVNSERLKCSKLQTEVENLALRTYYLKNAKKDMTGDLSVMKRAAEKVETEVTKAELEKQQQDLYVNRLVEKSDKLREEISLYEAQINAQIEETKAARTTLSEAEMEIETIQMEKKQLYLQWNSSIIGMRRRDEAHSAMAKVLKEQEQRVLTLNTEIEAYKRNISKEQEHNEKLTLILNKSQNDINTVKKLMAICAKKHNEAKTEYATRMRMLNETEQALTRAGAEKTLKMSEVETLRKQIEREYEAKVKIEDEILERIRLQMTMDKSAKYTHKMTHKLRNITRELESTKAKMENEISKSAWKNFDVESRINGLKKILEEVTKEADKKNETITKSEYQMSKGNSMVERKQQAIDLLNKKLEQMIEKAGGVELGPLEIQINSLSKSIDAEQLEIIDFKQIWLRDQSQLVRLVTDKDLQCKDIDKSKKQLTILSQKKIRIDDEIDQQNALISNHEREIRNIQNGLIKLNGLMFHEKMTEEELSALNSLVENEFCNKLKESEMQAINMQQQLESFKEEKERLLNSLIEAERQIMLWEKKTQLAKETKAAVDSEIGQGEIKAMRSEIHRMQVRYSQLMREQEKMIQEMEKAVSRRDTIVTRGSAQAKLNKSLLTNGTLQRNLQDLRKKIKQTIQDALECDKQMEDLQNDQSQLSEELEEKQLTVRQLKSSSNDLEIELDELKERKGTLMTELVSKQQKGKWLNQLKDGKYKKVCSDGSVLQNELVKHHDRFNTLAAIVDRLNNEFPENYGLRKVNLALKAHSQ